MWPGPVSIWHGISVTHLAPVSSSHTCLPITTWISQACPGLRAPIYLLSHLPGPLSPDLSFVSLSPPLGCPALRTVPDHVNKNALTFQPLTGSVFSRTWITMWNTTFIYFSSSVFSSLQAEFQQAGDCLTCWSVFSTYREPGAWKLPNNVGERPNCMLQEITSSF